MKRIFALIGISVSCALSLTLWLGSCQKDEKIKTSAPVDIIRVRGFDTQKDTVFTLGGIAVSGDLDEPCECDEYHKIWWDEELGYRIGQLGSIQYLIDWRGNRVGNGYHKYYMKDGALYGALGALEEIVIDVDGRVNTWGGNIGYVKRFIENEDE